MATVKRRLRKHPDDYRSERVAGPLAAQRRSVPTAV